ncbi:hypothetical protein QJS04_geneDACA007790 [Acorus gramineus]|uniref:Uncharacterized protein n=1 Tax=Acorus gramineus TaxID=55184 RepID=A0AAV9B8D7_ACOGR|nr:hypothetical protein QJS04_geneDACA007790 [Acorus gramineus]
MSSICRLKRSPTVEGRLSRLVLFNTKNRKWINLPTSWGKTPISTSCTSITLRNLKHSISGIRFN